MTAPEREVPDLSEYLNQILRANGAKTAALVDVGTGMVVRAAGQTGTGLRDAAVGVADEARLASAALGGASTGGQLEEILMITSERFQLLKVLDWRQGDGLLLFVDIERSGTNLGLAAWEVSQAAEAMLG
jgi:hypothetical protein